MSALAGEESAPTAALFGFTLGKSDRSAINAWAAARAITCAEVDGVALRCAAPATELVPLASSVFYRFDGARLVAIDVLAAPSSSDEAAKLFQRIRQSLAVTFGAPHADQLATALASAPAGRLSSQWRFRDLTLDVSAFHGADGARVRLQARTTT